jgi:hypothetical protein
MGLLFNSEVVSIITQGHKLLPHFNLVGWDFGLDNFNQYVLIEPNLLGPGLNYHQIINGPIFEEYLAEICARSFSRI